MIHNGTRGFIFPYGKFGGRCKFTSSYRFSAVAAALSDSTIASLTSSLACATPLLSLSVLALLPAYLVALPVTQATRVMLHSRSQPPPSPIMTNLFDILTTLNSDLFLVLKLP